MTDTRLSSQFTNLDSFVPSEPKAMTPVMDRLAALFQDTRKDNPSPSATMKKSGMGA